MSKEIFTQRIPASETLYAVVRKKSDKQVFNPVTPGYEAFAGANYTDYAIPLAEEEAGNGFYTADFPTGQPNDDYLVTIFVQEGVDPAIGDAVAEKIVIVSVGGSEQLVSTHCNDTKSIQTTVQNTDLIPLHCTVAGFDMGVTVPVDPPTIDTAEIAEAVLSAADGVEEDVSLRQVQRRLNSVLSGKRSGAGTDTEKFRNAADTVDVVTAVLDSSGNRLSVTINDTY